MSALTPHIRVLRALSVNLQHEIDSAKTNGAGVDVCRLLYHQSNALDATADQLEAEEKALADQLGADSGFRYDPKGKPPPRSSDR